MLFSVIFPLIKAGIVGSQLPPTNPTPSMNLNVPSASPPTAPVQQPCKTSDMRVLEQLFNATGRYSVANTITTTWDFSKNSNNLYIQDACTWSQQITCSLDGSVTSINLQSNGNNKLSGTLPSSIGTLSKLESLYLGENQFYGTLPNNFQNLFNLKMLDMHNNRFVGTLPHNFFINMKKMNYIDFSKNFFTGNLPNSVGSLTLLNNLYVTNNWFNGSIPDMFENLINLKDAQFSYNQFSGKFPTSFCKMIQLQGYVQFSGNYNMTCYDPCLTIVLDRILLPPNLMLCSSYEKYINSLNATNKNNNIVVSQNVETQVTNNLIIILSVYCGFLGLTTVMFGYVLFFRKG
jgi:hypothetical protein